ncbi:MAG: hypothetical protein JNL32_09415 [Candidatus Kapabacteria bacterium]|nr:hypothetical protein [Candidatus Kapabacteria bacterium]
MTITLSKLIACCSFLLMAGGVQFTIAQPKKKQPKTAATPETKSTPDAAKQARADSIARLLDDVPFLAQLRVLAKPSNDSIVLRWAPTKSGPWRAYNNIGYVVERQVIENDGDVQPFKRLTATPLKPWTIDEWKQRSKPDQQFAAIALQCLYGRLSVPDPKKPLNAIVDAAQELENKFGFSLFAADNDAHAANGLALRYVDKDVQPGKTYLYRVLPARSDSLFILDTGFIAVSAGKSDPLPAPSNLSAEEMEGKVLLRWKNPLDFYSGFYVYRTGSDGKEQKLTPFPLVAMTPANLKTKVDPYHDDTTAGYYKTWTYSVRGIDPFGELSEPAIIKAMGRDKTAPPIPFINKPVIFGNIVTLTWEMKKDVPDLAGFVIERSDSMYSRYHPLHEKTLPRTVTAFRDSSATADEPFYSIMAIDTAGNLSEPFPLYVEIADTLPPSVPEIISATIDTSGIVKLLWKFGKERDLLGYRVLWANDSTHEFTQRTNLVLQDTVFYDSVSVQTLTRHIYYKIVAVDNRYYHSQPTRIISIRRPDVIPPESPVFSDVFVTDSSIVLRWEHSRSDDVKEQMLYRRVKGESSWMLVKKFAPTTGEYTDTAVRKLTYYQYQLQAADSTGLLSPRSNAVEGRPYDTGIRPPVSNLNIRYDDKSNSIALAWTYTPLLNEKYWFVIYRAFEDFPLRQYRAVGPRDMKFTDTDLVGKGRYRYSVRVFTNIGESHTADIKEIEIR